MTTKFLAGGAVLAFSIVSALAATPANAVVWTSALEYRDGGDGVGVQGPLPAFGTVTIRDGLDSGFSDGNHVLVSVSLANPNSLFVNTGGPHDPFLYNTVSGKSVAIQPPVGSFVDGGHGSFAATPFGTFTDKIGCCLYPSDVSEPDVYGADVLGDYHATTVVLGKNGKVVYNIGDVIHKPQDFHYGVQEIVHHAGDPIVGKSHVSHHAGDENNGASAGQAGQLIFLVTDLNGISFAGDGYVTDANGKLMYPLGSGDHFSSNAGGWWFSADIFDGATGLTYNVAARDATTVLPPVTAVPEPAAWALMILGFGAVGAALRRRRWRTLAA